MSEDIKFTEEEMKQINSLQNTYLGIQNTFGQIGMSRLRLQNEVDSLDTVEEQLRQKYSETQTEEKNFVDTITKKYGDGQLNIDTGTFTPKETKKEDSKENK